LAWFGAGASRIAACIAEKLIDLSPEADCQPRRPSCVIGYGTLAGHAPRRPVSDHTNQEIQMSKLFSVMFAAAFAAVSASAFVATSAVAQEKKAEQKQAAPKTTTQKKAAPKTSAQKQTAPKKAEQKKAAPAQEAAKK
jgi:hypothetical protein